MVFGEVAFGRYLGLDEPIKVGPSSWIPCPYKERKWQQGCLLCKEPQKQWLCVSWGEAPARPARDLRIPASKGVRMWGPEVMPLCLQCPGMAALTDGYTWFPALLICLLTWSDPHWGSNAPMLGCPSLEVLSWVLTSHSGPSGALPHNAQHLPCQLWIYTFFLHLMASGLNCPERGGNRFCLGP